MAPNVKVPANFGKEHIGSPSHDNLVLKVKDAQEIRTNSMILSLNSPVIDNLTTNLCQTSLDMDDFEVDAINCFIACCYVGELENVQRHTFRDVNKMAHVFEVSWLVSRCASYFTDVVDNIELHGDTWYNEMLYIFEEARYMYNILKKENFLRLVTRKIEPSKAKFARNYMKEFVNLSKDQLYLMIELVGNNVEILVEILIKYCEVNYVMKLDENSRYFMNNMNLTVCYQHDVPLFDKLFDMLHAMKDMSNDDLRMVLALNRKAARGIANNSTAAVVAVADRLVIPNLFHEITIHDFGESTSVLRQIIQKVDSLSAIENMYMFVDAIYCLLRGYNQCMNCNFDDIVAIEYIMQCRGWNPISKKYVSELIESSATHSSLKTAILSSDLLVSRGEIYEVICKSPSLTVHKFLVSENKWVFHFKPPGFQECSIDGICGFVLTLSPFTKAVPANSKYFENFNIELSYNPEDYPPDVHIHEELVSAKDMHVAIRAILDTDQRWYTWPISWYGKPRIGIKKLQTGERYFMSWGGNFDFFEEVSVTVFMTK